MIAVNASTSPHSSESFTPCGSNALILEKTDRRAVFSSDAGCSSPYATGISSEHIPTGRLQSATTTGINAELADTAEE